MLRKNKFIKYAMGFALLSSSAISMAVTAPGGNVRFTGTIVNAACAVNVGSMNQTVELGQYRTAKFTKAGDYSGSVPFSIKLEDCDTGVAEKASVSFSGSVDSTDSTVLSVSNLGGGVSGAASGVGIEISDSTGKIIKPDGSVFSTPQNLNDGIINILNFTARYKSTLESVKPGQADADATFTMQYE